MIEEPTQDSEHSQRTDTTAMPMQGSAPLGELPQPEDGRTRRISCPRDIYHWTQKQPEEPAGYVYRRTNPASGSMETSRTPKEGERDRDTSLSPL